MASEMLIVSFFLGAILIVVGTIAFLTRLLRQDSSAAGGVRIQLGKVISLDTPSSSVAFVGIGLVMMITAISGTMTLTAQAESLERKGEKIERLGQFIQSSTPIVAAVSRIPSQEAGQEASKEGLEISGTSAQSLQETALESLGVLMTEEDQAVEVLSSLSENSFGLVGIPAENAEIFGDMLADVTKRFPNNAALQLQAADLYRSLYQSTQSEEYLETFGQLALSQSKSPDLESHNKYEALQLSALYWQGKREHVKAVTFLEEARPFAPTSELYKVEFNLCNNYHALEDFGAAVAHCETSLALAADVNAQGFWAPYYILALIEHERGKVDRAAELFVQASDCAKLKGEGEDLMKFLKKAELGSDLCSEDSFRDRFRALCEAP